MLEAGDLLLPGVYMEQNGTKISGIALEVNHKKSTVRVFLNNGKDCWYDIKTIVDLFQPVDRHGNVRSAYYT